MPVQFHEGPTFVPKDITLAQLRQANCGQDVGKVELISCLQHLVFPRTGAGIAFPCVLTDPVKPHQCCSFGIHVIVRGEHPALAGGNRLGGIEAERCEVRNRSHPLSAKARRQSVRRILNHVEVVPNCK